jgi:thiol-disulfide isomerase/thioredoxin
LFQVNLLLALFLVAASFSPIGEANYNDMLAQHKGKVIVVSFWSTACAPCRKQMPMLRTLATQFRSRGLVVVTVSADVPSAVPQALKLLGNSGMRAPFYRKETDDSDQFMQTVDKKWDGSMPAIFLYDHHGQQRQSFIGETSNARVLAAVRRLI